MIIIDLSFPRKCVQNTAKSLSYTLSLDEHRIKKCKVVTLGTLAAVFSFSNTAFAESFKNNPDFIGNHLYPNLFALCDILKQTNYTQISLAIEQIKKN